MHEEELHFLNFSGMIAGACQEFLIGRTISFENDLRCCPVQTGRHTMIITHFGPILYLLLLALIVLFWLKVRGLSFDDILEKIEHEHHHVHRVIAKHPLGGKWKEHQQWLEEEDEGRHEN